MIILKLAPNIKLIAKSQETRKQSVRKTTSRDKPPSVKSTNFHEIQINFHDIENDSNQENRLIV